MIISTGATTGCCHLQLKSNSNVPKTLPAALRETFAHSKRALVTYRQTELKVRAKYSIWRFEIPAPPAFGQTNRTIVFDYYGRRGGKPTPVIMVLPIAGGSYGLERHFASYFARHGLAAVIVHRQKLSRDFQRIEDINRLLTQTVLEHQQVIDWIEAQPELDAARIGIFGVSMGAIKGALLTPLDERVKVAVLGLVGGDLPYILTRTTESGIAKRRMALLREQHRSLSELEQELKQTITCDPNNLAPYVDAKKVLLVLAAFDTVVPIKKGRELRAKMGNPETIILPAGHYTALVFLPYVQRQALGFIQKQFARSSQPATTTR